MTYNSRNFNTKFFQKVLSIMEDCDDAATTIRDAFADYENVGDLPSSERSDAREDARDAAFTAIGEFCTSAQQILDLRAEIEESVDQ